MDKPVILIVDDEPARNVLLEEQALVRSLHKNSDPMPITRRNGAPLRALDIEQGATVMVNMFTGLLESNELNQPVRNRHDRRRRAKLIRYK